MDNDKDGNNVVDNQENCCYNNYIFGKNKDNNDDKDNNNKSSEDTNTNTNSNSAKNNQNYIFTWMKEVIM